MAEMLGPVGLIAGPLFNKLLNGSSDAPTAPPRSPEVDPEGADKAARDAQKKQRQAAAAAVGRADTMLTPAGGLGTAESTGNAAVKTLLGM